jgi:hypothetical protein
MLLAIIYWKLFEMFDKGPGRRNSDIAHRWPMLSPEDIERAGDDRERLMVRIVDRYGISMEWAKRQIADWERAGSPVAPPAHPQSSTEARPGPAQLVRRISPDRAERSPWASQQSR